MDYLNGFKSSQVMGVLSIVFVFYFTVEVYAQGRSNTGASQTKYGFHTGSGEYLKAGVSEWKSINYTVNLSPGDSIRTNRGEHLELFCAEGRYEYKVVLESYSQQLLEPFCLSDITGSPGFFRYYLGRIGGLASWAFKSVLPAPGTGVDRGGPAKLSVVSPIEGRVLDGYPLFEWANGERTEYPVSLNVLNEGGESVFSVDIIEEITSLALPDSLPPLEPGQWYTIVMKASNEIGHDRGGIVDFYLADSSQRQVLESTRDSLLTVYPDHLLSNLAYAAYLLDNKYIVEARSVLLAQDQDIPAVKRMLAQLYRDAGLGFMLPGVE